MTDINKYANNTSSSSSSSSGSVMYICLFAHLLICYLSSPFHLNLCQTQKLRAGALFPSSNHDTIYIKWTNMYPYHELHALTKLTNIISQIYIYIKRMHAMCCVYDVLCRSMNVNPNIWRRLCLWRPHEGGVVLLSHNEFELVVFSVLSDTSTFRQIRQLQLVVFPDNHIIQFDCSINVRWVINLIIGWHWNTYKLQLINGIQILPIFLACWLSLFDNGPS